MKKRIINITVEFDLDNISADGIITSRKTVKNIMEKEIRNLCEWDEGFSEVKVEVVDIED